MRTIKQSNRVTIIGARYVTLRSYEAYVAQIDKDSGTLTLGRLWHYSSTTWRHVREFIINYMELFIAYNEHDDAYYTDTHGWIVNMLQSKNGRAYMQTLVDNGIIRVKDADILYDRMIDDD